jgi:8-oxo-dGTP pyrophosphatase MutT (NUDIX family)
MAKLTGLGRWVIAIYTLVRNRRGRVLLLRRSQSVSHFPGCWELPGGKPFPSESIAKTAELEVDQETGIYVPPTGVAGAAEGSIPGLRVAMLILEGRSNTSKVRLSGEHDAYCWIEPARVHSLRLRPGFDAFFARSRRTRARTQSVKRSRQRSGL